MSTRLPRRLALCLAASMGCNGGTGSTTGSQATAETSGTEGSDDTSGSSAPAGTTGSDAPATGDGTITDGSTSTASGDTTGDTGPEPFPEECYEPEALIDVTSAVTPDGPITVDEAWLGVNACDYHPYVVLAQYPSAETGPGVEVILVVGTSAPAGVGIHPLTRLWETEPVGTIELLEPLDEMHFGLPNPEGHLHGRIELQGRGWDLQLEVDLLDCGLWDCFCSCR